MQKDDNVSNDETINELETVEIVQENQIAAMTDQFIAEHIQISSAHSTFGLDVSCSDDDEVSEVDSFILDPDDQDAILESNFLLPQSIDCGNLHSVADPDTHAKLEALLEAAGIGQLSASDGKALTDPEVLRKLTSSVNCALDEAAQALHRMRVEQQSQFGNSESQRSLAEACSDGDVPTVRKLLREGGSVHETTEEGDSLLSLACSAGYYELAQVLLAMKANVEDRGIKGDCTPLMEAASGGYVDIVKLLIAHGTDVNAQSSAGNTPLHYAACGGYEDIVQVLIEAGANVEQHNENGHTPLMEAASAGHVGVAAILLNNGAGINTHSNEFKESALTLACYKGHLEMVKFLLEAGADQEHKTDEMHTALMEASMDGHVEVARVLLDSGAQVNMPADSFESPLTLAACGGHVELADLLIARGANMEEVNDEGYTPLMEAAREGHEEMVALLLAHDADINAQTEETQETALTLACCGGFQEVADFLITAGANIELGCSTPLMEAAQEGHLELVKYLLKCNAKVNAPTGTGDTALTYACENGHADVADVLLQYGAELEHESEGGRTPLMKAARAGHISAVQFLISRGADVNRQTTTNDHTVLSLSCAGGHQAVVELLLVHGADPMHKLKDGSTMVIEAAKGGHTQVVKMLLEFPNRVLMNQNQDLTQVAAVDSHHIESRVPIHGLANIVPPSEPDSHSMRPNAVVSTTCEHFIDSSSPLKKKVQDKEIIIPKAGDQIWQSMQKSLKRSSSTGNQHNIDPATKSARTNNLMTSADLASHITENDGILSDFLPDDQIDLKAGERLEAIISNVMAKELINTTSTREEQILRKQQILEELQKVEHELQEKAQQQLLITAQHQQQQQQQQFQKALHCTRQPLHKALQKQLEEQKKNLCLSSQPLSSLSPADQFILESQMPNNFDQQVSRSVNVESLKTNINPITSETMVTSSQVNNVVNQSKQPGDGAVADKQKIVNQSEKNGGNGGGLCSKVISGEPAEKKTVIGNGSILGTVINGQGSPNRPVQCHNGGNQSSQMINQQSQPLCQVNPMMSQFPNISLPQTALSQAPPKPPQLTLNQLQQLQIQQQQQQTVLNQQFVLNENQRQTLQNFILHHQQEAQQFAQPTTPQYSPIQLTQDHLLQVFSQQQHQFTVQQLQQAQHTIHQQQTHYAIAAQQQQLPHQGLLQQTTAFNPAFSQTFINPQQQQQILQQQQQAQLLQQQLQQIKSPLAAQIPKSATESKAKCMLPMGNQEVDILGIETITPPPSTPLTPNPSPASPSSISPLCTPIDLDAQTESNHDTALTLACAGGHSELVTLLLSKGADIEHRDKKGFTPLILAATAGHTDVVEILLEHGADIEAQSERTKDTPLSLACSGGRYEVVELLLSRGANKEHRNVSDYTPLSLAASGGFVNIIKLLLSNGAEINSRTGSKLGISPLMLAAMNGHTAAVKLLLDMSSDINAQIETNRNTALTLACFQGRHEVVSLLVDRKANIEHRAKTGLTPLMEAASGGYVEVGRVLLDKGADVNAPPVPSSRDTALTIAADKGHYRFVELLLSRHSVVDVKNKKGNSPLWLACNGGHLDVVQLLVTAGADIDSQDNRKVSCLMAAFRKGHIKVVKWMVKHVNQFPSDAELSRYISTITDKELQKKCQQCMEIIVSAKDQQAAEANKNATDLLEELDKERQEEESRRAAAAKKRERKKKKKKLKSVQIDPSDQGNCKNSTPEPESEDSQQQEAPEVMVTLRMPTLVIEAPMATTTSTLGMTLLQETELSKISKPFEKKPVKKNNRNESARNIDLERLTQDENKDPRSNKTESGKLVRNNKAENTSKDEARKNKKNRKDREKEETVTDEGIGLENDRVPNNPSTRIVSPLEAEAARKVNHFRGRKKVEKDNQMNCTTAIGDLDDFGNLPSISDKDIEKLRKNVEKTKISPIEKTPYEKAMSETSTNMMSIKSSQVFVNNPKRGQKKEDGWKEVIRKSKKVQVPASAISRVIGRAGCNIKGVREISGANIDVEKNKGSGDRTITIKGSAEATRHAHTLIMALISDPDKELSDIIPKPRQKPPLVENKSLYFIPPVEATLSQVSMATNQSPVAGQSKASNKCLAPRLQQQAAISAANQSRDADVVLNAVNSSMVWANSPAPGLLSARRNTPKGHGSPYSVPSPLTNGPTNGDKPGVTRQLFAMEKRSGFGNTNSVTAPSSVSTMTSTTHASSCFSSRTDVRLHNPSHSNNQKTLVPGTIKLLQRPSGPASSKHEPQPLPIVPNQLANTVTTQSPYNNGLNMSSSGEFSLFDNRFSNAAVQLLSKKEDGVNERMNFANVAAVGVLPTFSSSFMSQELNHIDPALQARAPGFKLPFGPQRMSNPLEIQSFMQPQFRPPMYGMPVVDFNMMGLQDYHVPASSQSYPNQSPDVSPRSSQCSTASLSPRSNSSGFEPQLAANQKEEYTTPNQPMTLPKISSSLNPNAPDFTSRSPAGPFPGCPPNYPTSGVTGVQQSYPPELAKQFMSSMFNVNSASFNPSLILNAVPGSQDPLTSMSTDQHEFCQNMTNLMHQFATVQTNMPGSPVLGAVYMPPLVTRPFSPLAHQGRPNSAPSVGGLLLKDGVPQSVIGPPHVASPRLSTPPPMQDGHVTFDDRRQLRPIGGERSARKPMGPPPGPGPDYGDAFWTLPAMNLDWNSKMPLPSMTSASLQQTSVMSTSVMAGGTMVSNPSLTGGDSRMMNLDNSSFVPPDDVSNQRFPHFVQSFGLQQVPLFNGVGPPHSTGGFVGGTGDGLHAMWSSPLETCSPEDMQKSGMWNWSK